MFAVRFKELRQPSPYTLAPFTRPDSSDQVSHDTEAVTTRHSFSRDLRAKAATRSSTSAVFFLGGVGEGGGWSEGGGSLGREGSQRLYCKRDSALLQA